MDSQVLEEHTTALKSWLLNNGGKFHPDADFKADPSGFSVVAKTAIAGDDTIVQCPFELVITPEVSRTALLEIFPILDLKAWTERQLICSYVCLHWTFDITEFPKALKHLPYINTLPKPEQLTTPLHFTKPETEAFIGTNLYGASLERQHAWQEEWKQCYAAVFLAVDGVVPRRFIWEQYLQASTYLSSRAFPSTVLSATPSLVATPASYPILIPGVDALNHARAHPVSWVVSQSPSSKDLAISLVLYTPTPAGGELFNNYGPKPNSELILAYGFSLHNNPDDTIVLSVGGVPGTSSGVKKKWEVGRNAKGIEGLWEHILEAVAQAPTDDAEGDDAKSFEDQLDAAGMLSQMCQASLDRLPAVNGSPEIRPHVRAMLEDYLEGQRDILESIMRFAQEKEEEAVELAEKQGIKLDYE